jgi:hypothetical protein
MTIFSAIYKVVKNKEELLQQFNLNEILNSLNFKRKLLFVKFWEFINSLKTEEDY